MNRFRAHKYEWTNAWGARHSWQFVGPDGGIHFHVSVPKEPEKYSTTAGLEFHHARSSGYGKGTAPHHLKCEVIGEPCWHDGTSLYASETLWPRIEHLLRDGDHEAIFRTLEREYDRHFAELAADAPEST